MESRRERNSTIEETQSPDSSIKRNDKKKKSSTFTVKRIIKKRRNSPNGDISRQKVSI